MWIFLIIYWIIAIPVLIIYWKICIYNPSRELKQKVKEYKEWETEMKKYEEVRCKKLVELYEKQNEIFEILKN